MVVEQLTTIYHYQENSEVETIRATWIALDGDQFLVEYPIGGFSRYGMARYGD